MKLFKKNIFRIINGKIKSKKQKGRAITFFKKDLYQYDRLYLKKKYLRLNSLGLPGDFIPLLRITKILLDTHQIYNMVETDTKLKTVVSDNVLYHRGSHVGASHCQSGQGGKVYNLNKKIIRA